MEKRDKIIEAAIKVLTEKGMEKTKISDIAKEAGIGQGTFYLYFSTKLAVMPAIAEVMISKIEAGLQALTLKETMNEQLEQIVDVFFSITREDKETFTLIYAGLTQTQHVKEWENMYSSVYLWFEQFLNQHISIQTIDVKHVAKMLVGLIESTAEQVYLFDELGTENEESRKQSLMKFMAAGLQV
ncbi:TetR family transcriptional regulator [Alkalihalobacillus pseudalcaliphilus]|uniref:TetR family transcriptional regulator n=1 Tax=Alkalihalobacillus pseudalcaliphilus TaxID=79884 RepID=UPI00064DDC4B|nr:TetR family transcriptional regulator [Alkalihalobacillus pseudalcaliphilus]KMK75759.1 TetR family transcriptional regulator [Alkalihalobacillus pseudalcaliphilus]